MRTGTLSEYAAHIEASAPYVTKLKKQGRLVMVDVAGKMLVNFDATDRLVRNTTDLARAANGRNSGGGSTATAPVEGLAMPPDAGPRASAGQLDTLYRKAQTQEKVFAAKQAQLEYEEAAGLLLRAEAIKSVLATTLAATRDALLQIPARVSAVLAAELDPAKVHDTLQQELHQALAQLATAPDRLAPPAIPNAAAAAVTAPDQPATS